MKEMESRWRELLEEGAINVRGMPYSLRIIAENVLRNVAEREVEEYLSVFREWRRHTGKKEIPISPTRVVLQDFTGVPLIVDLAAMRDEIKKRGGEPSAVNPRIPVQLVIDHSVQVNFWGRKDALILNMQKEFEQNIERYRFLKWGQKAFKNLQIVPPGMGIIHQVNMEFFAEVVTTTPHGHVPEVILGTDSHTTMINGIGVVGWGVGGIEAEAALLGFPVFIVLPEVIGVKLTGKPSRWITATDIALKMAHELRKIGVVDKFVEVIGPGIKYLSVPERATISNMSPEYGCTITYFPVDEKVLEYLQLTGKDKSHIQLVSDFMKANKMFFDVREEDDIEYNMVLEVDLGEVEPLVSGPSRPHDSTPLTEVPSVVTERLKKGGVDITAIKITPRNDEEGALTHGSIVIAAITSCTNTSNPHVLIAAGLLAKKAVEKGLKVPPFVKTSFAPGSGVVEYYLRSAGLLQYLEELGFYVVGRGCTTCIGNSGPLSPEVEEAIRKNDLYVAAVLSGNRNFEGRIHNLVRMNFLASPPLVVAYAILGNVLKDITKEPLGYVDGSPVFLNDILPDNEEIARLITEHVRAEYFKKFYENVSEGNEMWQAIDVRGGDLYEWDPSSTYIRRPPFWEDEYAFDWGKDIQNARCLALLGDSITTDHISPAGAIPPYSPAGQYLQANGVKPSEFNSYGARRGNHEVMMRGTFANVRLKNRMVPDKEGGYTLLLPEERVMTIYEAAMEYRKRSIPLIIIAGKEYGSGSSRDWAAKGTFLLGVRAVIAKSFERIHRSNLVQMGVLPLQFIEGMDADSLSLTGREVFHITGIHEGLEPGKTLTVIAVRPDGNSISFPVKCLLNSRVEVAYYLRGGILRYILMAYTEKSHKSNIGEVRM